MSDECIELDKANIGIAARSSEFMGESKFGRHINGNAVRDSLSSFFVLNDPHKFLAKIAAGRSTFAMQKIRMSLSKARMRTRSSTYKKDA